MGQEKEGKIGSKEVEQEQDRTYWDPGGGTGAGGDDLGAICPLEGFKERTNPSQIVHRQY